LREITIAIDGPAASGKSTVGEHVARKMDYIYLDTGVMYRAVTWAALDRGIPIEDDAAISQLAEDLEIRVLRPTEDDGRQVTVLADGTDITWEIRSPRVNRGVSPVSAYPGVRQALTARQRAIGKEGGVVMVGRDIGTVVLPDAEVKVYLDASLRERARRRHLEDRRSGKESDLAEVMADLERRDQIDSTRAAAPLRAADDATIIDSTNMTASQVVERVLALVRQKTNTLAETR
jgi:CMP/dCMP kinase